MDRLASAEILHVNVGAQPGVVGQIPAIVVRVCIDHHVVAVPIPVAAVRQVKVSYAESEATKPEAAGLATLNAPPVATAKAAIEVAILPGVIEAKAGVVAVVAVPHPFAVAMDVRRLRVTLVVVEMSVPAFVTVVVMTVTVMRVAMMSLRTMPGNISAAHIMVAVVVSVVVMVAMLCQRRQGQNEERGNNCGDQLHEVRTLRA